MALKQVLAGMIAAAGMVAWTGASFGGVASVSTLTFDLKLAGGGQTASVQAGDVEHLEIWLDLTGAPQTGVYDAGGSFISDNSAVNQGNFSNPGLDPVFAGKGSQLGTASDYDGDGDLDWGSSDPYSSSSFFFGRSNRDPNLLLPVIGSSLLLGTIDFTVTQISPGQSITLSFIPRYRPGIPDQLWTDGYVSDASPGTPRDDTTNPAVSGTQVVLTAPVPEPASLGLLGLGALGLLARRRRSGS